MDIIASTAKRTKRTTARPQSHKSAHRKVYLDTYARQSRGEPVAANTQPTPTAQAALVSSTPVQFASTPADGQDFVVETQPGYTPLAVSQTVQPEAHTPIDTPQPPLATSSSVSQPPHAAYLDVLTKRHQTAVAAAPEQLETITPPQQQLVPDSTQPTASREAAQVADKQLEVNLRALYEDSLPDNTGGYQATGPFSYVRTVATSALACGILAVGIFTFFARVDSAPIVAQPVGSPVIEVEVPVAQPRPRAARNTENNRVAVDPSHPVRIVISKVGVNAPVIGLGITPDGLIDVPEAYGVVGWYNRGVVPGKPGPAVIVGHYTEGLGGAFDNLYKLEAGDMITVTNGRGKNFTYKMTKKKEYHKDKVPMEKLFQSSDKSRLEIITCAGQWRADNYDKRLVVTAELVR